MKRSTKRIDLGNGKTTVDFSNERVGEFLTDHEAGVRELFEKLAEYEDTGLTPEQIREMDELYAEKCKELAEAKEQQGKLPILPCEAGDTI